MSSRDAKPNAKSERKLRADAERNRQRILEAAALEFAERGLGVTMDDIAARAGVGVGTVYRRFPEKSDLIAALFEERVERLVGYAEAGLEHQDPWEGLVSFVERAIEMHAHDRSLRELVFGSGQGRAFFEAAQAQIRPPVDRLVARAQASGQLRPDVEGIDMPMVQMMVAGAMDYLGTAAPDVWRRAVTIVLDGLRTSRDEPTPLPVPAVRERQMRRAIAEGGQRGGDR